MTPDQAADATACVLCGGRGGWWTSNGCTRESRTPCTRCQQTGWEPSSAVRAAITHPTSGATP